MASLWFLERLFVFVEPVRRRREGAAGRRALLTAALFAALLAACPAAAAAGSRLPPNLRAPKDLEQHLERLLDVSPTFRQQCDLIRRTPRVHITIGYGLRRSSLIDAETVLQKHVYGAIIVTTTIYLPGDLTELVVHELEHVCEQIEGVELETLAQQQPGEAHAFLGRYETRRARLAGRRAVRESSTAIKTRLDRSYIRP